MELCHRNRDTPERAKHTATPDRVMELNYRKVCTMQTMKQPVYERASNTEERNCSTFQKTYDSHKSRSFTCGNSAPLKCHFIKKVESGKVKVTFSFDSVKEILMCCLRECRNQNKILVHCCQVSSTELKLK